MSIKEFVVPSKGMYSLAISEKLKLDKNRVRLHEKCILIRVEPKKGKVRNGRK